MFGRSYDKDTRYVQLPDPHNEQVYPFEVLVPAEDCALREDAVALCRQIRTMCIEHRINEDLGSIRQERIDEVDTALEYSLGLTRI